MKLPKDQHALIAFHLILIALSVIVGIVVVFVQERETVKELERYIAERSARMLELAELTDRNAADPELAGVITDCPRRAEYEAALIQLGKLSKKDLITAQNLHESCGSFFAEQKALMVQKLNQEYKTYSELTALYSFFNNEQDISTLKQWGDIIKAEQSRSVLLRDLSTIQEQIITKLVSGKSPQGSEIQKLIQEAQQMNELLSVHDREVDALRAQISDSSP